MRRVFLSLLLLNACVLFGQGNPKKPKYVIIVGNEISTMEKVDSLIKIGAVKAFYKGVSEEERNNLFEKFGNRIGEKEFILIVTLFSDSERQQRKEAIHPAPEATTTTTTKADTVGNVDEYLLHVNDLAKDFSVKMINGDSIRLSNLKGKVVLLNFWATWCGPCLMEFYDFPSKIIAPFAKSDFVLLPISRGEPMEKVKAKMKKLEKDGVIFNVGVDPEEAIWKLFAKAGIPKSFLIDKKGIVRYVSTGDSEGNVEKIASVIKDLLKE